MKQDKDIMAEMREMFVDEVEDMARKINTPHYLDDYTDGQLQTMSKLFNQLGNKLWKHRNGNRAAYRRSINGRKFPDA